MSADKRLPPRDERPVGWGWKVSAQLPSGGWVNLPIGLQLGKAKKLAGQPMR